MAYQTSPIYDYQRRKAIPIHTIFHINPLRVRQSKISELSSFKKLNSSANSLLHYITLSHHLISHTFNVKSSNSLQKFTVDHNFFLFFFSVLHAKFDSSKIHIPQCRPMLATLFTKTPPSPAVCRSTFISRSMPI